MKHNSYLTYLVRANPNWLDQFANDYAYRCKIRQMYDMSWAEVRYWLAVWRIINQPFFK